MLVVVNCLVVKENINFYFVNHMLSKKNNYKVTLLVVNSGTLSLSDVVHSSPFSSIGFEPIESNEPQRSLVLVTRLHAVCQSLINMLT